MFFKRSVQRYGTTPEPETTYAKAGQLWDNRIGSASAQAANWRFLAGGAIGISLILSGGMVWLASQNRVTPYVVEVNGFGEVKAIGPALAAYNPSDAQIEWFLGRFISNVRSLSIDPVLERQNWLDGFGYTTDRAALFLTADAQANDPFAGVGERSVTVTISNIVRASKTSFQVKWMEQTFQRGSLVGTEHWTALLTVTQRPPKREDVLRRNPLGLYVTELAWSKDYSPSSERDPTAMSGSIPAISTSYGAQ